MTTTAPADEPARQKPRKSTSTPKLRDGVMKRGNTWAYVIRVPDPATGASKPKWVGGSESEEAAKGAPDEARIRARRGEYVNRSVSTVAEYLAEWAEAHASTVEPKTLAGYRHDIEHYIVPRIGRMRLQALRPAVLSKFYRTWPSRAAGMVGHCPPGRSLTYTALFERRWRMLSISSNFWPSTRPNDPNSPGMGALSRIAFGLLSSSAPS
jgi:hypothetical protein